jgi:hypothetical protein
VKDSDLPCGNIVDEKGRWFLSTDLVKGENPTICRSLRCRNRYYDFDIFLDSK